MLEQALGSWGQLDVRLRKVQAITRTGLPALAKGETALAYGLGRSYGDSCLTDHGTLWLTNGLDHFLAFDPESGVLQVEAGVTLAQIQDMIVPKGWSLAVVPGTRFVTVGGAIANDIHGKNHHQAGSFCDHVLEIELARTDGEYITCGPNQEQGWFAATAGGLGLTGIILRASLQLRALRGPWLDIETVPFQGLDAFFELADHSAQVWENTVSWIDCLSGEEPNGIFMRANPAVDQRGTPTAQVAKSVPFTPPISLINRLSLRAFNALYLHLGRRNAGSKRLDITSFHHPLDALEFWNRIYGPRGFYQYQCVIPNANRAQAIKALLRQIKWSGQGSFLVVLKTSGAHASMGMMSFPTEGVTLALDFPNCGPRTTQLLTRLDQIVGEAGGRLYPAKDARMGPELLRMGYPRLGEFLKYRDTGLSSNMSRRLLGE